MRFLRLLGPPLLGAAGIAVAVVHRGPLHAGVGRPAAVLRETFLSPAALAALVVAFGSLCALRWVAGRVARRVVAGGLPEGRIRAALVPALVGPGAAVAASPLDAVAFRCTAPVLLSLGAGLGGLAAWTTLRRGSPGVARAGAAVTLLVGLLTAAVPAALLPGWPEAAGDEPHYLVVAHSLLEDGDLDVRDEYADGEYRAFHPASLSPHYKPGARPRSRYSMHGPGLPLLLLPAYAGAAALDAGRVALPRLLVILLYGAFGMALYRLVDDVAGPRAALAGTLATTLLAPLVFAPLHLFPEVPAMLLGCVAYRALRAHRAGLASGVGAAAAVAALPWLGVKYLPVAAALVVGAWLGPRPPDGRRATGIRNAGLATAALAATLLAHGAWTWSLYGSISPMSIYLGSDPPAAAGPALGGDLAAYLEAWPAALATAIGYLADQKEGLLMYGPHLLLAAAGVPWMWRRRRRDLALLTLIGVAYVGPYALSQQLGGQGPPVRPLMAVVWIAAAPLGVGLTLPGRWPLRAGRGGLLALAATITALLALDPALLPHDYPVEASRLVRSLSPAGAGWWRAFPQWVNVEAPTPWATAAGTALLAATAGGLLWSGRREASDSGAGRPQSAAGQGRRGASGGRAPRSGGRGRVTPVPRVGERVAPLAAALVLVACGGGLLAHRGTVVVTDLHRPTILEAGLTAWVEERLPERLWAEREGIWVRPGRPMELVLTAPDDLEVVAVRLGGLVDTRAAAWIGADRLSGRLRPGSALVGRLDPGPGWPWRGRRAWRVRLEASDGAAPAELGPGRDERLLGAFLQFDAVVLAGPPPAGGRR